MKTKSSLFFLASVMTVLIACNAETQTDKAETTEKQVAASSDGENYVVDTTASKLEWFAAKQTGKHNGEFSIQDGSLSVNNGQLTGGKFDINVAAIVVNDLQGEDKGKLEGHLKSPDFFQVEKFPGAKFEITKVEVADSSATSTMPGATHIISGNLTLKDSTKNVTFPAKVNLDDTKVSAQADFAIDRTDWGLNYKGPNNPQDWFIKKEVKLKLDLVASKK
ncbi:MAG: YceI family protein [Bacteroidota bacterium]